MPKNATPRISRNAIVEDDYPIRPRSEGSELNSPKFVQGQIRIIVLFCFFFFLYGSGSSLYGPLFPKLAITNGLNSCIYGSIIATSHLACFMSYPIACRMVASVSYRHSLSVSIFIIGTCRMLFGTLDLIFERTSFIALSFAIQAMEGIGMSILLASTIMITYFCNKDSNKRISIMIYSSFCLGLAVGPIIGEILRDNLGFDITFYIFGAVTLVLFIVTAILLPEPDEQISFKDIPVIVWLKDKSFIIYFFISLATFSYVGFLSVCLGHILMQFSLKSVYVGMIFSIVPSIFVLFFPGWTWLIKRWFHSVLTMFFGSLFILGSLVLLGPATLIKIHLSLANISTALLLAGLGIACKSAGILESTGNDLRNLKESSNIQRQLLIPTVFCLGAYLGYSVGSLIAGFADFYIGYRKMISILFGLEILVAVTVILFAFNRNYISRKQRGTPEETQHILRD